MKQMMKRVVAILVSLTLIAGVCPAETQAAASEISTVSTASGTLEDNEENTVEAAGMTAEATGTNSIGTLLANTINEQQSMNTVSTSSSSETDEDDTDTEEAEDHIAELTVEGATATVSYATSVTADVVVAVYDESTAQMTASGSAAVETNTNSVEITLEGTMPTYFVATAYLMDAESHAPLSAEYSTNLYTQDMQEFLAKETTDFDENLVVNLDDSTDNNFMVFDEETTLAKESDTVNLITDNGDDTYTITNADETFTGLAVGDVVSYTYDDGTMLILVVKEITVDGTTVTITDDPDADLSDVFSYVKIDTTQAEMSSSEEDIATAAVVDTSVSGTFKFETDLQELLAGEDSLEWTTGVVDVAITPSLKLYLSKKYSYFEFKADVTLDGTIVVKGKYEKSFDIAPEVEWSPCLGVFVRFTPAVTFRLDGKVNVKFVGKQTWGKAYDSDTGNISDLSSGMKFDKLEVTGEAAVFLGVSIKPSVVILSKKIVKASCTVEVGVEFKGQVVLYTTKNVYHDCNSCVDGDINLKLVGKLELVVLNKWRPNVKTTRSLKLCDFYYSNDHSEFGLGTCPYLRYQVTVTVEDETGNPVPNTTIQGTNLEEDPVTGEDGSVVFFLRNGKYTLTLQDDDVTKKKITVKDAAKNLVITKKKTVEDGAASDGGEIYDGDVVDHGNCGKNLTWTLYSDGRLSIKGTGGMTDYYNADTTSDTVTSPAPWYSYQKTVVAVDIASGATSIGRLAFEGCSNLTSVSIPDTVTAIGVCAFVGCSALTSVSIPSSVISIGEEAFGYSGLTNVTIPAGVVSIESGVFEGCSDLSTVTIPSGVTSIGSYAFESCSSLTDAAIPSGVTSIGISAFRYCSSLTNEILLTNVTSIGEFAFCYCSSLTSVSMQSEQLTSIEAATFYGCSSLKNVKIPSGVISIGEAAFTYCTALASIDIPPSVCAIGDNAFSACGLTSVSIPSGVTTIEERTFSSSPNLLVPVPDTVVQGEACSNLTSISIPSSVTLIEADAFNECSCLTDVYYNGTEEAWNLITLNNGNTDLTNATIHYNSSGLDTALVNSEDPMETEDMESAPDESESFCTSTTVVETEPSEDESLETVADSAEETETTESDEMDLSDETTSEETSSAVQVQKFSATQDGMIRNVSDTSHTVSTLKAEIAGSRKAQTLNAAVIDDTESTDDATSTVSKKTAIFSGLAAGESYVMLVIKSVDEDALLTADNLLYIAQGTADTNGSLRIVFVSREDTTDAQAYAFGKSPKNLKDAEITVESLTYTGEAQIPRVKVVYDGVTLEEDQDYTLSGDLCVTDAGEYSITVTGKLKYSGSQTVTYQCAEAEKETETETEPETKANAAAPTFSFKSASLTKTYGDKAFTNAVTTNSDGAVTYISSNTKVATVTGAGSVTIVGAGTAVITATAAETANYKAASVSYTLTVNQASPTLKFKSSSLTKAMGGNAFTNKLTVKNDGKLTYKSSNTKVAKVNQKGKVTIKGVGKATITVTAAAGTNYKAGKAKYTVKVNPSKVTIKKVTNVKGKKIKITWKKNTTGTGYEIQYSTDKKFKKSVKKKKVTKNKTTSATYSKLTKNKKYYVRIRSYKKVSGKTYYSAWSSVKKVTVKK